MFDIQYQCKTITNTLTGIAKGTRSRRKKLRAKAGKARQDTDLADRIVLALQAAVGVRALADDIRMLTNYADTGGSNGTFMPNFLRDRNGTEVVFALLKPAR